MIWKRCPRCGKRIPEGTQCEDCKRKRDKARDRYYDKHIRNKDAKAYYASEEWRIARELALDRADGICQWTLATEGRVEAAEDVHHIIPLREDWSRRSDPGNLIALSHSSHAHIEYLYKAGKKEETQKQLFKILKST